VAQTEIFRLHQANAEGSALTHALWQDATYVYMMSKIVATNAASMFKLNKVTKVLTGPYATATVSGYVGLAIANGCLMTPGANGLQIWRLSDMTLLDTLVTSTRFRNCEAAVLNGKAYFCATDVGPMGLYEVVPVPVAGQTTCTRVSTSYAGGVFVMSDGTSLYVAANGKMDKLDAAFSPVYSLQAGIGAADPTWMSYDADNGYVWYSILSYSLIFHRFRASDGAAINMDGTVGSWPNTNGSPAGTTTTGGCYAEGSVFGFNTSGTMYRVLANVNPTAGQSVIYNNPGYIFGGGAGIFGERMLVDTTTRTVYVGLGAAASTTSGLAWFAYDNTTPTPVLTSVTPGAYPNIELTFNVSVDASAPTIGPPAGGVGVTAVTQPTPPVATLYLAVRPDHPVGQADTSTLVPPLGSAENLGPHVPTGVGAIVI
jgi:hypothetical protein